MELDKIAEARTGDLARRPLIWLWRSGAITDKINDYTHDHVRYLLGDMGLDWRAPWSESGEYDYLKEEWGDGYGN